VKLRKVYQNKTLTNFTINEIKLKNETFEENSDVSNSTTFINSLGVKMKNAQIKKPPYKIQRCDQVVFVNGERFISYYNYSDRQETFFEIGIYVVNMFDSKNTDKLIESVEQSHLTKLPDFIEGSGTCLDIMMSNEHKRFPICLESEEIMKQIQQVFFDFMRCRKGDDLKNDITSICKLNRKMKKKNSTSQLNSIINQLKSRETPILNEEKISKINPFYSPVDVPGS
jgi:hypothetical protein